MKIKLIDFGLKADHHPFRPHENDAGADVFMPYDCILKPGEIARIPLGFGLIIPDGFVSDLMSSLANNPKLAPSSVRSESFSFLSTLTSTL